MSYKVDYTTPVALQTHAHLPRQKLHSKIHSHRPRLGAVSKSDAEPVHLRYFTYIQTTTGRL
jgi:hypothetical protein